MKILFGITMLVCTAGLNAAEKTRQIELPEETEVFRPSDLPGYTLANASCLTCHSVEYVKYQPATSPRAYWQATVVKMQKTFGAPIPDAHVEVLVDYLAKTYGAEVSMPKGVSTPAESKGTTARSESRID